MTTPAARPRVVLGVGGGIAAYKACEVLRGLTESGHDVRVVPTDAALRFVGRATWEALSGQPVATDVWAQVSDVPHVRIGREADLVVVVPATADLLSRAATGRADAPAMHTEMWEHPATMANVATLRERGALVIDPASGRLTGVDSGPGRLPEPAEIVAIVRRVLQRSSAKLPLDLAGRRVVISAGGTREPIDPVRYVGNRSSGRQGLALAVTAVARGAKVVLVAANVALPIPAGVEFVPVGTAAQLREAVLAAAAVADAIVMAAAVADFRPARPAAHKIKKSDTMPVVELESTTDVLLELVTRRAGARGPVLVGFAAETGDAETSVLDQGKAKLAAKGVDLLVVNDVSAGQAFERPDNAAVLMWADGRTLEVPLGPKDVLADAVWDGVASLW
jgi:phosphopantothenoylcysteine decarboxylase/phosphopantothenate--cysteine ligase